LKVSLVKGKRRFNVRGKLSPRYSGPYKIIAKLNLVVYILDLPIEIEYVNRVFTCNSSESMLKTQPMPL